MRIKIEFKLSGKRQVLPMNYQYPVSAWIYKVLARGDNQFSEFLHEQGFCMENQKTFKLFTFSNFMFPTDKARQILSFQIPVAA